MTRNYTITGNFFLIHIKQIQKMRKLYLTITALMIMSSFYGQNNALTRTTVLVSNDALSCPSNSWKLVFF